YLNIRNQTGGESRHQPLGHSLELLWVLVTRDDDRSVAVMKCVERMEELFLSLLTTSQKLNVIQKQQVAIGAVARPKVIHLVMLQCFDELVREVLGRDIDDTSGWALFEH